jgi:internalin A
MLWLSDAPVTDLSPLRGAPLASLTMKGVPVQDLSPLASMTELRRLHIGDCAAQDLSPLAGLHLTQLIFTPGRVARGMEHVRQMPTLQEIGTRFDDPENSDVMPAAKFWELYDTGQIR